MSNRLKKLRIGKGVTQEDLADQVGTHHSTIQRFESGKRPLREPYIQNIAAALGIHPGELFEEMPDPKADEVLNKRRMRNSIIAAIQVMQKWDRQPDPERAADSILKVYEFLGDFTPEEYERLSQIGAKHLSEQGR